KFSAPANIVVTGAELSAEINTVSIKNNRIYKVLAGDVLNFGKRLYGARTYLSIQGGFVCDEVLGSCSWYEGMTPHFRLEEGMRLKFDSGWIRKSLSTSAVSIRYDYLIATKVSVFPGPEFYKLPFFFQEQLCSNVYSVDPASNRMAIQLREYFGNNLQPIITG